MFQKERLNAIMSILKLNGFTTVKYLVSELNYSTATINRDLNALEQMNQIKRVYGGVELVEENVNIMPLKYRYDKNKTEKKRLAKIATEQIKDGDTIFILGGSTTEYMAEYLIYKKDITVVTNNIKMGMFLIENGVNVIITGGTFIDAPYILGGQDSIDTIGRYKYDKTFMAVTSFTSDGKVTSPVLSKTQAHYLTAKRNSTLSYMLIEKEKCNLNYKKILHDFNEADFIITDYEFSKYVKSSFKNTSFIETF